MQVDGSYLGHPNQWFLSTHVAAVEEKDLMPATRIGVGVAELVAILGVEIALVGLDGVVAV